MECIQFTLKAKHAEKNRDRCSRFGKRLQSAVHNRSHRRRKIGCGNQDGHLQQSGCKHRLPTAVIDHREFHIREDFDRCVIAKLRAADVELVVMAGFMRILSPEFFRAFPRRIMNIHPALLPSFPGTNVQKKAVEYGVKFSGCTVHFADEGVDTGPIIIQSVIPVYEDDTADTLAERILREEHRIYPQAIQYYAEGRIEIEGRTVLTRNESRLSEKALHNPPLTRF
jgi:phosphoribosylglycinamide formyltransferase-1